MDFVRLIYGCQVWHISVKIQVCPMYHANVSTSEIFTLLVPSISSVFTNSCTDNGVYTPRIHSTFIQLYLTSVLKNSSKSAIKTDKFNDRYKIAH